MTDVKKYVPPENAPSAGGVFEFFGVKFIVLCTALVVTDTLNGEQSWYVFLRKESDNTLLQPVAVPLMWFARLESYFKEGIFLYGGGMPRASCPQARAIYRDHKGEFYRVVVNAFDASLHEWLVLYRGLSDEGVADFFCEKAEEFVGKVSTESGLVPRFAIHGF